jgi:FkbM family methyltransferase
MRDALLTLARRIVDSAQLRALVFRTLLRNDEIVPFGYGLTFDTHTWVIKETEYGFRIWVALGERSISRQIMLDRYERDEVKFVQANVKPGDHVVDIGANIGFYTALFGTLVGPSGHVIACEPLEALADALERTVAENRFADRVTVHRVALDFRSGTVLLRHAPITINQGAAYLSPKTRLPPGHVDELVRAATLDDVVGERPCAFVKLDAEGAEPRILAGSRRTIARCRPTILAELNPILLNRVDGKSANDLIGQMAANGYTTRLLRSSPSQVIDRYDDPTSINVIFSPNHGH